MKKSSGFGSLSSIGEVQPSNKINNPKTAFITATLSMSWQLAIVVLVPIIGGYELDQHLKTSPYLTILGFALAITGTVLILKNMLFELNQSQVKTPKAKK
ncbi:MAG TPA: AtpZ/AtpI family protein [Candidatus Saccharimonadales bacterium]|nr:AtpZ/AtpI family protein [Candidatus Saccharimonadales bacterium]